MAEVSFTQSVNGFENLKKINSALGATIPIGCAKKVGNYLWAGATLVSE